MAEREEDSTLSAHPINPQTESFLFSIPAETRNRIYFEVLASKGRGNHYTRISKASGVQNNASTVLSLLRTCRLIQQQAEAIFYAMNHLFVSHGHVRKFISETSLSRVQAIKKITVHGVSGPKGLVTMLEMFVRLQPYVGRALDITFWLAEVPLPSNRYRRSVNPEHRLTANKVFKKLALKLPHLERVRLLGPYSFPWKEELQREIQGWIEEAKEAEKAFEPG